MLRSVCSLVIWALCLNITLSCKNKVIILNKILKKSYITYIYIYGYEAYGILLKDSQKFLPHFCVSNVIGTIRNYSDFFRYLRYFRQIYDRRLMSCLVCHQISGIAASYPTKTIQNFKVYTIYICETYIY